MLIRFKGGSPPIKTDPYILHNRWRMMEQWRMQRMITKSNLPSDFKSMEILRQMLQC